jgi:hypothetical protein
MPAGRPTLYKPEYCIQAAKLCLLGATDEKLADFFDVNVDTIHEWKNVHPEFSDALNTAKDDYDFQVEKALFKRATGYTRKVEKTTKDGVVECLEELPPDPTSMIFWLKNRQSRKWRDKQEVELGEQTLQAILEIKSKE